MMNYYSTNDHNNKVNLRTAVMKGLAKDGGLFMPEFIPKLTKDFFQNLSVYSFNEIALEISSRFIEDEIGETDLQSIIERSFDFPSPVVWLNEYFGVLELFHGPTLAFKDFGARFMASVMGHFIAGDSKELNILVATSGDTGSAVANGFLGVEGIKVFVLYPSGQISNTQEKQITTIGKNIVALEIEGTFDDCQRLVKKAFVDSELKSIHLSSANSINIARLIPQTFYYFEAYKNIPKGDHEIIFSVPSGNLGNLTAGLIAKLMGLPINKFIAATNSNDVFTQYIRSGKLNTRKSERTLSNAMDVGDPSNLVRIMELFENKIDLIRDVIFSESFNDTQTLQAITEINSNYNYVIDPHGAVAYLASKEYIKSRDHNKIKGVILETAHPAKFSDVYELIKGIEIEMPSRLKECLTKDKKSIKLSSDYKEFKDFLLQKDN